MSINTNLSISR